VAAGALVARDPNPPAWAARSAIDAAPLLMALTAG
jgi:hypothetical protein